MTASHLSHVNRNLQCMKDVPEINDIDSVLLEATKFARRLNVVVKNVCPQCLSIIKDVLFEEEDAPTIQQDKAATVGGQKI
jgi:hypothetical protein